MADTTPLEVITFVPWVDPLVDPYRIDPTGHYSRLAWLPLLGPTSWVLIGTIAQHLDIEPEVTWQLQDLRLEDAGLDNDFETTADNRTFAVPGVFVP